MIVVAESVFQLELYKFLVLVRSLGAILKRSGLEGPSRASFQPRSSLWLLLLRPYRLATGRKSSIVS